MDMVVINQTYVDGVDPAVPKSTLEQCGVCGAKIWVAPSSVPMLLEGALSLCVACGVLTMQVGKQRGADLTFARAPKADEELLDVGRVDVAMTDNALMERLQAYFEGKPAPTQPALRVESIYAFLSVDPADGTEGIVGFQTNDGLVPMVGADMAMIRKLQPVAQRIAAKSGRPITVVNFSGRTEVKVIAP
jgi:hypothetical protein